MAKIRFRYIDIAAGILLIYMMMEHIQVWFAGYYNPIFNYKNVMSFYMPFFFFKSGMLSKAIFSIEKLHRDFKHLIFPWVITGVICHILTQIHAYIDGSFMLREALLTSIKSTYITGAFLQDNPTWFLLSLFIVKYIGDYVVWYSEKRSIKLVPLIILCSVACAYVHSIVNVAYCPMLVGNTFSGLAFYLLGYMIRNNYLNKWVGIVSVLAYIVCLFMPYPYVVMHWNKLELGSYLLWYPASLFGIITILGLSKQIEKYYAFPILNWAGKNALFLLCVHWPFLICFSQLFLVDALKLNNPCLIFFINIIACVICLPLLYMGYQTIKKRVVNDY